ncbi:MAG: hypothetical protein V1934_04595, partial [Methanobacteriota archaeon]
KMVHRTTQVNSAPGETPDVLEPISVDATTQIGTARNKCTEILELCDGLDAQLKAQIRARVQNVRAALTALQTDVEEIMDIAEPVTPGNQQWPQVNQAMVDIEALGHEARIFVVDMTRYHEVYPFMWPPEPEIDD